jgi:single stranded DNA-binding protein
MLSIMFAGNVGNDPVLRSVQVGDEVVSVANFSVAVSNPQGGDLPPTWIRVTVWRKYAEIITQYVHKGDRVSVAAESIKASAWTDSEGELHAGIEVTARRVDFSGNRRRDEDDDAAPAAQAGKSRQQQPARQSGKAKTAKPQAQEAEAKPQQRQARRSTTAAYGDLPF